MNQQKSPSDRQVATLLGILTIALVFIILMRTPQDADMWWHLRAGQVMWQTKTILHTDIFSYTRTGSPWVNAFWISEIILYLFHQFGGFLALSLLVALTGAITFFIPYRRMGENPFINAFIIVLAALTAAPIWSPRPQIFSFLILAALDNWLSNNPESHPRRFWILIPVFALWANIHGGWIWGFLLLAAHIVGTVLNNSIGEKRILPSNRKPLLPLTAWSIAAGLAIGLNPNGISIWRLPFTTAEVSMRIQEWASPDFHQIEFQPLLWMIFLLIIMAVLAKPKTNWASLLKLTGFAYLTFVSERNIAVFAIIAAPVLAEWSNTAFDNIRTDPFLQWNKKRPVPTISKKTRIILNTLLLAGIGLAALGRALMVSTSAEVEKNTPLKAVQWLRANPVNGHLFNSYNWGGYLTWSLPQTPVFIDGRADLYGNDLINQWFSVVNGTPQGYAILDHWNVEVILLEPNWPIVQQLSSKESMGWREVYLDNMAVIFVKEK